MEKVSQDTESLLKEATTTSKSLITNISNVAKHDEYIKDIKNKKLPGVHLFIFCEKHIIFFRNVIGL